MPALTVDERWRHRDVVATYGKGPSAGALATATWLSERGLLVEPRTSWSVSISLDVVDSRAPAAFADAIDTRLHIAIASTEWGFFFCHHSRASWIRVLDVPFVHERDDFGLRGRVPPLRDLGVLLRALEGPHRIRFRREHASIRSTIQDAEPAVREWLLEL